MQDLAEAQEEEENKESPAVLGAAGPQMLGEVRDEAPYKPKKELS